MSETATGGATVRGRAKRRGLRWVFLGLALGAGLPLGYYHFILDWQGRPYCHKQIMLAFRLKAQDHGGGSPFPNIGGVGKASLDAIREEMGVMGWSDNYRYVPGLREDDPGRLVLLYYAEPTRWTWHGQPPTIFTAKQWIIVPVDFASQPGKPGECSERVGEAEFKSRLRDTLEFIRTNARPDWQAVVAEHTAFLASLESKQRKPGR